MKKLRHEIQGKIMVCLSFLLASIKIAKLYKSLKKFTQKVNKNYTHMCIFFFFARIPLIQLQHSLNLYHFHPTFPTGQLPTSSFPARKTVMACRLLTGHSLGWTNLIWNASIYLPLTDPSAAQHLKTNRGRRKKCWGYKV